MRKGAAGAPRLHHGDRSTTSAAAAEAQQAENQAEAEQAQR